MNTPFALSYAFNPLSVAINCLSDQLQLDLDTVSIGNHSSLPAALMKLISYDISRNTPFMDPSGSSMGDVAAEWLMATTVDELACTSTLNLWLTIEWTNTKNPTLGKYSSKLTTSFLQMLRTTVENKQKVTDGTIFAASNHLATYCIFYEMSIDQRNIMMNGLEALVNARGGVDRIADSSPGLLQSLLWTDVMNAWLTGTRPRFLLRSPPPMPYSLIPERTNTSVIPAVYENCCGPDLLDTAKYLRMFLLFRHGSETRALTKAEYQYMVSLERFIHVQLLSQQAHHNDTGSTSECIVLAMGLVRMRILCIWEQHFRVRRAHIHRLVEAMRKLTFEAWRDIDALPALVWLCWVLLAQSEPPPKDLDFVIVLLKSALKGVLGEDMEDWSPGWPSYFSDELEPLLWHADYDAFIPIVADLLH